MTVRLLGRKRLACPSVLPQLYPVRGYVMACLLPSQPYCVLPLCTNYVLRCIGAWFFWLIYFVPQGMKLCFNGMDISAFALRFCLVPIQWLPPPPLLQPATATENSVAQIAAVKRCSHCPLPVYKEVLVGCSGTVPALCLTGDWLMRKTALCLKDKSQQISSRWY